MSEDAQVDPIEDRAQQLLAELEAAPPEVQLAVVARLMAGVAAKMASGLASKAIDAAKTPPGSLKPAKKKAAKKDDLPSLEPQLQKLNDPFDPIEAWEKLGGVEGLKKILPYEPTGILETMLRHPNMPAGPKPKSNARASIAKNIIERLEAYFI